MTLLVMLRIHVLCQFTAIEIALEQHYHYRIIDKFILTDL